MSELVANQSSWVGRTVDGRFRLEQRLGTGSQGATYRARHVEHQRVVALKLLHERVNGSSARRASFECEASTLRRLAHPNIATLVDCGVFEGQAWLAVEWLEGETLATRLERGALPLTAALAIVRQLLAALASAHGMRLIHRNLKPANIFLERSPTQSRERVKLLDFTPLLLASASIGSPYSPPELAAGETLDARADVFAVGMTLIDMLNTGAVDGAAAEASSPRPNVPARGRPLPGVDATLLTWIRRATSPHRPLRFADAADALRELIDLLPRELLSPPARVEAANRTAALAGTRAPQPPNSKPYVIASPASAPARTRAVTIPPPPPASEELEKPALSTLLQRASVAAEKAATAEPAPEAEAQAEARPSTLRPIERRIRAVASEPRRLQLMAAAVFAVFLVSGVVIVLSPGVRGRESAREAASDATPEVTRETVTTVRSLQSAPALPALPAPAKPVMEVEPAPAKRAPAAPQPVAAIPQPQPIAAARPDVKPRPDARGLAIVAAPGRPPVRDPWQDSVPAELKRAHMSAQNGAPGDEARIKALREYNRDHPDDVRGYLVIGQFYLNRLWRTDCVEEWTTALTRDPGARGAPEILPALLDMTEQGKAPILAERLIMKVYGSEALDPIELAFADVKNPNAAARLHALRLRISEGKAR